MTEDRDSLPERLAEVVDDIEQVFLYFRLQKYGEEASAMLTVAAILEENLTAIAGGIEDLQSKAVGDAP